MLYPSWPFVTGPSKFSIIVAQMGRGNSMNSSIRVLTKPGIDVEGSQHWFDNVCVWGAEKQICHPQTAWEAKLYPIGYL